MASFTQLSERQVVGLAAEFGVEVRSWRPLEAGTINSNFALQGDSERYFLRVNEGKSDDEVRYEARVIDAFAARGVATPRPLRTREGECFARHEGAQVSLFPWIEGEHVTSRTASPERCMALGAALRGLHEAATSFPEDLHRVGRYAPEQILERYRGLADRRDPVLAEAIAALGPALEEWCRWAADEEPLVVHGDLFPDNVLFSGDAVGALLDFEQTATASATYDLAVCLNAWCFAEGFEPERARALLAGYGREADAELWRACRAAAARFLTTRITDVYLAGEHKPDKDFRRFLMRLQHWDRSAAAL
jgi:homoserine kinase type II